MIIENIDTKPFCAFAHYCGDECVFVGWGKLANAFAIDRSGAWLLAVSHRPVSVIIMGQFAKMDEAARCAAVLIETLEPTALPRRLAKPAKVVPDVPGTAIRCTTTGRVYASASAAARRLGVSQGAISNVVNGRQPSVRGYSFRRLKPGEAFVDVAPR